MPVTAVFGGSFSPVHLGHMQVARTVVSDGLADEVVMMPCRRNPLKNGKELLPDGERLNLLRSAISYYDKAAPGGNSHISVSGLEFEMPDPSFTVNTLRLLIKLNPGHTFRLVVGADSYISFSLWKDWQWIESNCSPIVYPRPGYDIDTVRKGWTLLEGVKETDISSTRLREILAAGGDVSSYMPWIDAG